jgi:hypothetical protein
MVRSFFGRRYMRRIEDIGTTEKVIGVFLLLLIVGIVAGFAVQVSSNREYLFEVDEAAYRSSDKAREVAVAGQMLPTLGDLRWRAVGEAEAIPADDLPAALGNEASDLIEFGVQWVYQRRYETVQEPRSGLTALVCDAGSPAQAFGLCRTRRPADFEVLNVGRDGWLAGSGFSAGFWNGRYYTELNTTADLPEAATTFEASARVFASVQLGYGNLSWAERMLPLEGRIPGSFRYMHRAAWGIESLNNLYLVDLNGGVTAWVMDAETPSRADAVIEDIKAHSKSSPEVEATYEYGGGEVGTPHEIRESGPLTIVPWEGGGMAVFPAGRFVHGVFGSDSDRVTTVAMSAYVETASRPEAPADTYAGADEAEPENPFPDPGVENWRVPGEVSRYTPDTLYQKINGRADAFLQFHAVGLTFGTYYHGSDSNRFIDVYWYDMGEPVNAFGMYRAEAPPESTTASIGADGYETGGAVFFRKGSSYVQVLPVGLEEDDTGVALKIAERLAARIEDSGEDKWALGVLPQQRRIDSSFEYIAQNAFGLAFLTEVFAAEYDLDEVRLTLFVHRAKDAADGKALFDQYGESFDKYGRVIWRDPDESRLIVAGEVAGMIDVVFAKGRYLGGVAGAEDVEAAKKAAAAFYDGLTLP